ncbi:hypothetical protein SLEP1_g47940 [Rubroshorea leprosula]|uniref:Uncharacterized protein n=1 Tax=Rubroshorea leprosula TaxID=152421 RepID=A0AAV5LSX9_9ROSI|nr:hypothetical protein SLEP1_g47940 [Rubroshorea leprosula]
MGEEGRDGSVAPPHRESIHKATFIRPQTALVKGKKK